MVCQLMSSKRVNERVSVMSTICLCGHDKVKHEISGMCTVSQCRCTRFNTRSDDDTPSTSSDTLTSPASSPPGSIDNDTDSDPSPVSSPDPDFSGGGGSSGGGGADS